MNKYKLLNQSTVLAELNESIDDFLPWEKGDEDCLKYWKNVLNNLTVNQYKDYITWENIERFENIHYLEAIFLLLNLPTRFLLENKKFDLFKPFGGSCFDESIRQVFSASVECVALERSYQEIPRTPFGDEMIGHYQVTEFVEWAINTGFVKKIEDGSDNNLDIDPNKNPLGKYNNYRGWAKVHNTIATLVALKLYKGNLESTSSILKDKTFYEHLSKELAPIKKDGQRKPKPHTLENYISQYNNFNK